jgi:flagellar motor switch protein FliN/FliY
MSDQGEVTAGGEERPQAEIDAASGGAGVGRSAGAGPAAVPGGDAAVSPAASNAPERQKDAKVKAANTALDEAATALKEDGRGSSVGAGPGGSVGLLPAGIEMPDLAGAAQGRAKGHQLELLEDVELNVKIELGRSRMFVEDVLNLAEGSVVELDKLAGDPVDVLINDRLVARGEVLVLNDNFCVRISEIISQAGMPVRN